MRSPRARSSAVATLVAVLALAACEPGDPGPEDAADEAEVPDEAEAPEQPQEGPAEPDAPAAPDDPEQAPLDPEDAPEGEDLDAEVADQFAEIVEQVSELRGLPVEGEIPLEVVTAEELVEIALADVEDELERFERTEAIAVALHQIPDDADLLELNEALLEAGAAGLYVPEDDQAYIVGDEGALSPLERVTVAHEVQHALQDQHIDLGQLRELQDDPDAQLAFSSLIEGDAVMVQEQWAAEHLSQEEQQQRQAEELEIGQEQAQDLQDLPPALLESFVAPYVAGPELVGNLVQDGGVDAVDAALGSPPTTMVEVYDPSLYRQGLEPEPVELGEAPDGYEPLDAFPSGAFDVELLYDLADDAPTERTGRTAWRGGELAAWRDGDDVTVAVGWTFVDDAAAEEVCDLVPAWHATVAGGEPTADDDVHEGPDDVLVVDCAGFTVRYAVAPDEEAARTALGD